MDDKHIEIQFSKVELPELKEIPVKNYYMAGVMNKFFQELIFYYEKSPTHGAFVKNLAELVVGTGMEGVTDADKIVIEEQGMNSIFTKTSLDNSLYGGWCVEVIWSVDHTKINTINYIDFSKIRSGFVDKDTDEVEFYFYSNDWFKYRKEIVPIQAFNTDIRTESRQLFYYKEHSPGFDVYPKPIYYPGLEAIYTDVQLSSYYANLVKNNFVTNKIISVAAPMDQERQIVLEKGLKDQFTGSENAGGIMVVYADGALGDKDPIQVVSFNDGADDQKYQWLSPHIVNQIIMAHRIPNPLIAGVMVPGSLGGSDQIIESEQIYNKRVVYPTRNKMLDSYNELISLFRVPFDYTVNDNSILDQQKTEEN